MKLLVPFTWPDILTAVGGTKLPTATAAHVGVLVLPAIPLAIFGMFAVFVPVVTTYWALRPYCSVRSKYLFAVPSVRTHPRRAWNVYPEGSAGELADVESRPAAVEVAGFQITKTAYH